jgi:hypothetical protein
MDKIKVGRDMLKQNQEEDQNYWALKKQINVFEVQSTTL